MGRQGHTTIQAQVASRATHIAEAKSLPDSKARICRAEVDGQVISQSSVLSTKRERSWLKRALVTRSLEEDTVISGWRRWGAAGTEGKLLSYLYPTDSSHLDDHPL